MISFEDKILILDGAMCTMIQRHGLTEEDYHCGPFSQCAKELKGKTAYPLPTMFFSNDNAYFGTVMKRFEATEVDDSYYFFSVGYHQTELAVGIEVVPVFFNILFQIET